MLGLSLRRLLYIVIFLVSPVVLASGRVEIDGKGLSIVLPQGWSVEKNVFGASILSQAPVDESVPYRRNIRVMSFSGSKFIDQVSLEQFAKEIEEKSAKMSNQVRSYQVRDMTMIELADQTKAGLFYSDFFLSNTAMMQMRVLVSSQDQHFLLTYTDVQENFENTSNGLLDQAFQSFLSVQLSSKAPARYDLLKLVLPISIATIGLIGLFTIYRKQQVKRLSKGIKEYSDDEIGLPDESDKLDDLSFSENDALSKKSAPLSKTKKNTALETQDEFEFDDDDLNEPDHASDDIGDWKLNG